MNKKILIILIVLVIIVGGYFVFTKMIKTNLTATGTATTPQKDEPTSSPNPFRAIESSDSADFPSDAKILITGKEGTVEMDNFFKKAEKYWPEGRQVLIKETDKFQLIFYRNTGEFELTLKAGVQADEISNIESSVVNILNIGKNEVCRLKFIYQTEYVGDRNLSSDTLPLCSSVLK